MAVKTNTNKVLNTYDRTQSIEVRTTWDRLYVKLDPHVKALSKERGWVSALSFVITIILALCTSDFKPFIGMSADTIKALFIMVLIISVVYLIYAIVNAVKCRKETLPYIVDDVFEDMTYKVISEEQTDQNSNCPEK